MKMPIIFSWAFLSDPINFVGFGVEEFVGIVFAEKAYILSIEASLYYFSCILYDFFVFSLIVGNWVYLSLSDQMSISGQNDFSFDEFVHQFKFIFVVIVSEKDVSGQFWEYQKSSFLYWKHICYWVFQLTLFNQLAWLSVTDNTNLMNVITYFCHC